MPPDQPSHTFAVPALGVLVPIAPVADDAKNPCDYAPCALSMAHRTMTFTFRTGKPGHYRWQCFVPCAAGLHVRVRRADADDRLHGRLPERGLAMATPAITPASLGAARQAVPHRVDRVERDRDAARRDLPRPGDPARQRQRRRRRSRSSTTSSWSRSSRRCACSCCCSSATCSPVSAAAAAQSWTGRRFAATRGSSSLWMVVTTATVLFLAGFGTYELTQVRLRRRPGPERRRSSRPATSAGDGRPGDRAAVGVHVPLSDVRRRRSASPRAARRHADPAARHLARRDPLVLGLPARRQGRREPGRRQRRLRHDQGSADSSTSTAPSSAGYGTATCSTRATSSTRARSPRGSSVSSRTSQPVMRYLPPYATSYLPDPTKRAG